MRGRAITYDTGFFHAGLSTHETFDPDRVKREMRIMRDLSTEELLALLADCAERAEHLRQRGAKVVFLTGSELSLFTRGFLPGETLEERLGIFANPGSLREVLPHIGSRVNTFLVQAVGRIRTTFGGNITYASLHFENVDWTPFDFVAIDAGYRSVEVADRFRDGIRAVVGQGKPVAITEFGCCTYHGAADRGGRGDQIIVWDGPRPVRLNGTYKRDEAEQARYLCELLDMFESEGVDSAFVNTFVRYNLLHRAHPAEDLDLASYGIVKLLEGTLGRTYPGMPWEPKLAFTALAERYRG